jgi:hypothetical protein
VSRNPQYLSFRCFNRWLLCLAFCLPVSRQVFAQPPRGFGVTNVPDAHVVIVEDPGATQNLQPVPEIVQAMVDRAIITLTGATNVSAGWKTIISPQDVVGLKVCSAPGPNSGTRKDVVAAVVQGLLAAGLPPHNIIVWDRHAVELRLAGFNELERRFGIRVLGSVEAGYDEKTFYETSLLGSLTFGDLEFGKQGTGVGRKSFVSKLVTHGMTKIINITPLLHHNIVGVSGNLMSLAFGSVDNTVRFEGNAEDLSRAVPEIYALPILGDRVILNIVDALICQYDGQHSGLLHYSVILNQLRFSRDPLALDVLSLQEINRQRDLAGVPNSLTNVDLYSNAALLEIGISDPRHIQVEKIH